MSDHCQECRRALWHALEGHPNPARLTELSVDRHVVTCPECREILEREQALETLLVHLPDATLPPDLAGRVVARLRASLEREPAHADPLDRLLSCVDDPAVPVGLGARLAARARVAHDDELLERVLDRVPVPAAPADLAPQLLGTLAWARRSRPARRVAWSAAAALLVALAAAFAWVAGGGGPREATDPRWTATLDPADRELIEALVVLENWELLIGDELELLLSSVDPVDELLLDLEDGVADVESGADTSHG